MVKKSDKKPKEAVKKSRANETVREKAARSKSQASKPKRRLQSKTSAVKPKIKSAVHIGKKEFFIPLPDTKAGRFLNKPRHIIPKFFRDSWKELKLVTWPNRSETFRLTIAVFIFAIILAIFVASIDWVLTKLFREILLGV